MRLSSLAQRLSLKYQDEASRIFTPVQKGAKMITKNPKAAQGTQRYDVDEAKFVKENRVNI